MLQMNLMIFGQTFASRYKFLLFQLVYDYLKMNKYCLVWENNMAVSRTIHNCKCIIIDGYSTFYVFCYTSNILYYVTLTSENHIKRYIQTIVSPIWRNPNTCAFTFDIIHLHGNATCTVRCHYNAAIFLPNPHNRHPISHPHGAARGAFGEFNVCLLFCAVIAILCEISWHIVMCYNGTACYLKQFLLEDEQQPIMRTVKVVPIIHSLGYSDIICTTQLMVTADGIKSTVFLFRSLANQMLSLQIANE